MLQGQESKEKLKILTKVWVNSVKNGCFWKKLGSLTKFEKISDFVCWNLQYSVLSKQLNGKRLTKNPLKSN